MTLTVGSLFAGIGGLDKGFEDAGFEVRWQVEIDEWARRVLTKHWPDVPKYEDVRDVGKHNLEWVDVIVGGFPCQDISNAGKRAGITGERSGLWSEYARIVRALRPRYVVVENVAALLHRGLDIVLRDLAQSGYDAEWQVLPAAAFGAPHRRERVFILAHASSGGIGGQSESNQDTWLGLAGSREGQSWPASSWTMAHSKRLRLEEPGHAGILHSTFGANPIADSGWWAVEPPVGRVANGIPRRVDRLRGLGNAVVPQVAQYVAEYVKAHAEAQEAA